MEAWRQTFDEFLRGRAASSLPDGCPSEPPPADTAHGPGALVQLLMRRDTVRPWAGSVEFLQAVGEAGCAALWSPPARNARGVLRAAGLEGLFDDVAVDGGRIRFVVEVEP